MAGGKWTGTHGSNYAARSETKDFGRIGSAGEMYAGEIVYKAREPGDDYYDLPDKYRKGGKSYTGDLRDYYHVGVVTRVNPLEITHCTSPGPIAHDTKQGKWLYGGRLKDIDYGGKGDVKTMVTVRGGNENAPINMRAGKSTGTTLITTIPQGSEVELLEAGTDWSRITYGGYTGYVMTKFIQSGTDDNQTPAPNETILVSRAELEEAYDIIGDLLGLRG